ncbi:MAG: hypothetical protein ACN6PN_07330 [Sphingobacterium sp.]
MMLKKEKLELIRQFYPNALTTIDVLNKTIDFIEDELNMPPSKVMLADSICSDDVNSIQYPARATQEFLGPFKMGGLDGFPFTGLTGMGAFASHVPDDGAVLIYYGPHIGISKESKIGEILRYGQHNTSGCCGAAKGALKKLSEGTIIEGNVTDIDYQMNTIEQILFKQKDRVLSSEKPIHEATEVIYEAIDQRIQALVDATTYNCKYVLLMGGVMINSDSDVGSFSSTKRFDVINLEDKSRKSFLSLLA